MKENVKTICIISGITAAFIIAGAAVLLISKSCASCHIGSCCTGDDAKQ